MTFLDRRTLLTAVATLATAFGARKLLAATGSIVPKLDDLAPAGREVPEIHFTLADGTPRTLADYRGKGVVLNFWATWCAPCVREMPALARLNELVADANVAVLPLSSDRGGAAAVERYFHDKEIAGLPVLLDPRGEAARAIGARGIPTTLLIDRSGRERGRYEGAADWSDPAAVAAVKALAAGS